MVIRRTTISGHCHYNDANEANAYDMAVLFVYIVLDYDTSERASRFSGFSARVTQKTPIPGCTSKKDLIMKKW